MTLYLFIFVACAVTLAAILFVPSPGKHEWVNSCCFRNSVEENWYEKNDDGNLYCADCGRVCATYEPMENYQPCR